MSLGEMVGNQVAATLAFFVAVGAFIAVLIIGAPLYLLGRHQGYEKAQREQIEAGRLIERYDPSTGTRIREWK